MRVNDAIGDVECAKNDCHDLERKALGIENKVKAAWKEVEGLRNEAESARKKAQAAHKEAESARSSAPPDLSAFASQRLTASRPLLSSTAPSLSKAATPTENPSESCRVSRKPNSGPLPSCPTPFLDMQIANSDHNEGDPADDFGDMDHNNTENADHTIASPTSALLSKYTKPSPSTSKNLHQNDDVRNTPQ
ncbi:hypothetical protein VKT23_011971 [Stygiomarasmius scandens]|uniref:Uncharacterized protein n=1 Tax=Marasmiellus scandens TaxID=2682957 RepID=A0ABR1JA48_9AGAR